MRKSIAALSALLLAQTPAIAAPAQTATQTDADPALWVVKDKDTTIYLFGTVHALKPGLGWFDEAVKTSFDKSDELVLELIEPEPAALQSMIVKMAFDLSGKPLSTRLGEPLAAKYQKAMGDVGMPYQAFEQAEPWFVSVTLAVLPLQKLGYKPEDGVEKVLRAAATSAGKKVDALETAEQQMGYFDTLPEPLQIRFLEATIDEMPRFEESMTELVASWAKGDPETLATQMNEAMTEVPEIGKVLLDDRNARWAEWIKARMDKPGTVFMAVGAGHLAGDASVQKKLDALGFKTTRVAY